MTKQLKKIKQLPVYLFLTVISFLSIFPFYWMIVGSTNLSKDITLGKLSFGNELVQNFIKLNELVDLQQILFNSFKISVVTTVLALLITSMAGYGFEVYRTKQKDRLFGVLMLSMMLPFAAIMIPLFRLFSQWGLMNNHIAVILPALSTAFLIFFFRQNTKFFPKELLEAARIDGLSEAQSFLRIYIPSMKSAYAAAAIITFMTSWNSFLWPLIVLTTDKKKTLPLVISSLSSAYAPDFGVIMVAIIISTIPMILIFFALQKYFVAGMVGSVK
ncbi:MAG: carbohydrate ABC transporter permease [Erysipelotrichaceae bacterium]